MKCTICGATKGTINHHVSYSPEKTVPLCYCCHGEVHNNPDHQLYPKDERPQLEDQSRVAVRIPSLLNKAIKRYVKTGIYMNESDFVRAAIREKLESVGKEFLKEEIQKEKES